MQAYFWRAKAACLCLYCCNCHLCYDGWRLGRVKTVTLRVGARVKEGKREARFFWLAPFSPPFLSFNMHFRKQNIHAPEENACTAGHKGDFLNLLWYFFIQFDFLILNETLKLISIFNFCRYTTTWEISAIWLA